MTSIHYAALALPSQHPTNVLNHDAHSTVLQPPMPATLQAEAVLREDVADAWRDDDWHFTRRRAPSASSEVAACIAGEARSFVYPVIHHNLRQSVIDPLRADSFMVLSTTWTLTGNDPWPAQLGRLTSSDAMYDAVTAAVDVVDPVSSVVSDNAGLSTRAPRAWQHCFCSNQTAGSDCDHGVPARVSADPTARATCSPLPTLTLSWRGCLTQIVAAEVERSRPYRHVLRLRPDMYALSTLAPLPQGLPRSPSFAFFSDFAALMTRDVAAVSLRQLPQAGRVPSCWEGSPHLEYCNACLVSDSGFDEALSALRFGRGLFLARHCTNGTANERIIPGHLAAHFYPYCAGDGDEVDPSIGDDDRRRLIEDWAIAERAGDASDHYAGCLPER